MVKSRLERLKVCSPASNSQQKGVIQDLTESCGESSCVFQDLVSTSTVSEHRKKEEGKYKQVQNDG